MPTATVSDVKEVISTGLDDPDISDSLSYAESWNQRENSPGQQSTAETRDIERWAAILNIRQFKERSVEEDSVGGASSVFEGDELQRAKAQLAQALSAAGEDPTGASSVLRDSSRHVTSTG